MTGISQINAAVKIVGRWVLAIVLYMLLYSGADEGLWPLIAHYRHNEWNIPNGVESAAHYVVFPFAVGCLLAGMLRRRWREAFPWPFLIAPFVLLVVIGYVTDSFYPPFWTEFITRLVGGAIQGVSVGAGWFLYRWLSSRRFNLESREPVATEAK